MLGKEFDMATYTIAVGAEGSNRHIGILSQSAPNALDPNFETAGNGSPSLPELQDFVLISSFRQQHYVDLTLNSDEVIDRYGSAHNLAYRIADLLAKSSDAVVYVDPETHRLKKGCYLFDAAAA